VINVLIFFVKRVLINVHFTFLVLTNLVIFGNSISSYQYKDSIPPFNFLEPLVFAYTAGGIIPVRTMGIFERVQAHM
jgi:hypothetical protein